MVVVVVRVFHLSGDKDGIDRGARHAIEPHRVSEGVFLGRSRPEAELLGWDGRHLKHDGRDVRALEGGAAPGEIPAPGADHKDAPLTKPAAQSDVNDLYSFKGESAGGYTAVTTVKPLTSPADTGTLQPDRNTVYEVGADTNGDAVPNGGRGEDD